MKLVGLIVDNMHLNGGPLPNRDWSLEKWILSIDLGNDAINELLGNFMDLQGELGLKGISISLDLRDILDEIQVNIDLSDTVRAGLTLDALTYLREPLWNNKAMVATQELRDKYTNITVYRDESGMVKAFNQYYNVFLNGDVSFGLQDTTQGMGIGGIGSLLGEGLENLLVTIGVDTNTVEKVINSTMAYKLSANIDVVSMDKLSLAITLYNPQNNTSEGEYLFIYYEGGEDTLYLDLNKLNNLNIGMLGTLPKLKIENLGLRDTLRGINIADIMAGLINTDDLQNASPSVFGLTVDATNPNAVAETVHAFYNMVVCEAYLASQAGNWLFNNPLGEGEGTEGTEGTEEGAGLDIMAIIGVALDQIEIDRYKGTISVIVASNVLTALMGILNMPLTLPSVNAGVQIKLGGFDFSQGYIEDGILSIKLALLDDADKEIEAISLELDILKDLGVRIGEDANQISGGFKREDFIELNEFIEKLKIGVKLTGYLDLNSDEPSYENDYINDMLSGLLEGLAMALKLNLDLENFRLYMGFEIVGNININDI
ncbi:MAG: hypothetical protein IKB56_00705, partial [Clostridia bacterium]|nr:hypothetical protein [Clostridia bacterium]